MESIQVISSLPESLSPTSNVRRSCSLLMKHESYQDSSNCHDDDYDGNIINNTKKKRSVIINSNALHELATKITKSIILDKQQFPIQDLQSKTNATNATATANVTNKDTIMKCLNDLNFANWDAAGWHYTGSNYSRPHLSKEIENKQRFERVALYVMIMDCINFCFWPVVDDNNDNDMSINNNNSSGNNSDGVKENLLEYEHLAIALKELAEADDVITTTTTTATKDSPNNVIHDWNKSTIVQAEDSYALAPQNLINLDVPKLLTMIKLPSSDTTTTTNNNDDNNKANDGIYTIPNPKERTRLIIELAQSLLTFHNGSATHLISKANKSADVLVFLILQYLPGFRDSAVHNGYFVAFYKRAQILVADLWAALGAYNSSTCIDDTNNNGDYCNFHDMEKVTTFADYRVPQLLRHLNVLVYSPSLSKQIDEKIELVPFCADELYIRAATVVAVDELVNEVKSMLQKDSNHQKYSEEVNAVKMDWYLWNIGEKLDRRNEIENHHRVRTIFY